jgi:hypothetical protein
MKNLLLTACLCLPLSLMVSCNPPDENRIRVYEVHEVTMQLENYFDNPYKEIECWVELSGPGFNERIYGFWNGGNEFVFRLVATAPGKWRWKSFSEPADKGVSGKSGSFNAIDWTEEEISQNPNRRGFIRPTPNGRALEYADGTIFFMLGDTWWSASTWRYPLKGIIPDENYIPAEGISFEEAISYRKNQGYNTIGMIAAYPNWKADQYPAAVINKDQVSVRHAWRKNGTNTAKDMHDEYGNLPFGEWDQCDITADYDRINPEYFKSLDKKIQYLNDQGFIAFLETVRRDHGQTWKKYFDWPDSFSRYVQYIIARYGAYNIIFSGIHLDWLIKQFSLTADEFAEALTHHYNKYGGLPYKQPHTILIEGSTYTHFGHGDQNRWLTMHSVGNAPRHHAFYPMLEEIFSLDPPYPAANLEAYYVGWDNPTHNVVAGERPVPNSDRDNYFGRTQMYGSVFSGGLAGHLYGTGAYGGNTTGEPKEEGDFPYIWEALKYPAGAQLQFLAKFLLSEGKAYQDCEPRRELLFPDKAKDAPEDGLDGWSFMLIEPGRTLAFLYFENRAEVPVVSELLPQRKYKLEWFDPISGEWTGNYLSVETDGKGSFSIDSFPDGGKISAQDWCLKFKLI